MFTNLKNLIPGQNEEKPQAATPAPQGQTQAAEEPEQNPAEAAAAQNAAQNENAEPLDDADIEKMLFDEYLGKEQPPRFNVLLCGTRPLQTVGRSFLVAIVDSVNVLDFFSFDSSADKICVANLTKGGVLQLAPYVRCFFFARCCGVHL